MSFHEIYLSKEKLNEKSKKESLSLYSISRLKETTNSEKVKQKSKTQEKVKEEKQIRKEEVGYKIGQYLIKKTIGKGSFGKVKLGIYLPNKEKVAIKILDKKKITEKDDLIRIKREFEMLSKFDHPNIILIAEILETQERYYSVMEYCEGGELFNYIVKKRHLNEEEASFFFYQLINGLEYIHSLGIVHRDLKPENLLLTKTNLLKIIDFGLSNYHDINSDFLLSTPCGSPCYASPEMVSGLRYDGYKIDIWSCGVILFAMLCGYLPFENKDNDILFQKILKCKVNLPDYLSDDSKDLILKILVKDPDKRLSIEQIKNHPFYLKGKNIFHNNFEIEQINFKYLDSNDKKDLKPKEQKKDLDEKEKINNNKVIKNKNMKNEKILIIENINQNFDEENNKNIENKNNVNKTAYQPILTDYDNHESKNKAKTKENKVNKNSKLKNNSKRVQSSGIKSKHRSSNLTKDNFNNIIKLLKINIFTHQNKKISNLQNKKSHKAISSTSKNFSSGNLNKRIASFLNYKNNNSKINYNAYELGVLHTDINSKNKESSFNYINRGVKANNKIKKGIKGSDNISKKRLLTDIGMNNLNIFHQKLNKIAKLNKKGFNYLNYFRKKSNKENLLNNLFDKYIQKITEKKNDSTCKKSQSNSKSKEKVIKLTKKGENNNKENINKFKNLHFDMSNLGLAQSDFSSLILKTEPNQYIGKSTSNNILLNEIIKNINTNPNRKKKSQKNKQRKNDLKIIKQKSIPTLSDLNDNISKNNLRNILTSKNKRSNLINNNFINKQRINLYNLSKKAKKIQKKTQNNSLTKKSSFFTIRNTMINLNIHTPTVIISSYNKKNLNEKQNKKYNSNIKYSNFTNSYSDSIFSTKNENNKESNPIIKQVNKILPSKTGFNLDSKKSTKMFESEKLNTQCNSNKNKEINSKFHITKFGNIIKFNHNNKCKDKKMILSQQMNLNHKNSDNYNNKNLNTAKITNKIIDTNNNNKKTKK